MQSIVEDKKGFEHIQGQGSIVVAGLVSRAFGQSLQARKQAVWVSKPV